MRLSLLLAAALCAALPIAPVTAQDSIDPVRLGPLPAWKKCHMCGSYENKYDKFSDTTTRSVGIYIGSNNPLRGLTGGGRVGLVTATYQFAGQQLASLPATVRMTFAIGVSKATNAAASDVVADTARPLLLLLDDSARVRFETRRVSHDLAVGRRAIGPITPLEQATKDTSSSDITQVYSVDVPLATFVRLATAQKVEGRLGAAQIEVPERGFLALRNLASSLAPGAPWRP